MNPEIKRLLERAIITTKLAALARRRRRHDVLILAYHNVLPPGSDPSGDVSLHLRADRFIQQIELLRETHEVVPLASILQPAVTSRPRVAITFDDAYAGALSTAIPELVQRGMPATIFVAPGLLGGYGWWDELADPQVTSVPAATRDFALSQLHGDGQVILKQLRPPQKINVDPSLRIGTEAEVRAVSMLPGVTIGSHTWSHPNMASLDADWRTSELERPMRWLRERFASFIPWVSYPYGLFSNETTQAASALGYVGGLRIDGGWLPHDAQPDRMALPRYNVPSGLSMDGFRIRLAGLLAGG